MGGRLQLVPLLAPTAVRFKRQLQLDQFLLICQLVGFRKDLSIQESSRWPTLPPELW